MQFWNRKTFVFLSPLLLAFLLSFAVFAQSSTIKILTVDDAGKPLVTVKVELKKAGVVVSNATTNEKGEAQFTNVSPGTYEIVTSRDGLEPRSKNDVVVTAGTPQEFEFLLVPKVNISDSVNVTASAAPVNPVEQGASTATDLGRKQINDTALRPHTVAEALPLVPGVVRDEQGQLKISGSGENRSALLVRRV